MEEDEDEVLIDNNKKADEALMGERRYLVLGRWWNACVIARYRIML